MPVTYWDFQVKWKLVFHSMKEKLVFHSVKVFQSVKEKLVFHSVKEKCLFHSDVTVLASTALENNNES